MHLYHVLPVERLREKQAWAEAHGGRLQLTGHRPVTDSAGGTVARYLHLLPNLVGGLAFSSRHEVRAIRVTLREGAVVARLRGPREVLTTGDDPPLARAAREAAVVHVFWDEPGITFQEWLLVDEGAVAAWTADPEALRPDFQAQLAALRAGAIGPEGLFYPDLDPAAQIGMAERIGQRLGLHPGPADPEAARRAYDAALHRLGVDRITATRCLFFVGPAFLRLAAARAGEEATALPLAGIAFGSPWDAFYEALEDVAGRLEAHVGAAAGPVELWFDPPDAPEARAFLGFRCAEPPEGLAVRRWPADRGATWEGPLWDLDPAALGLPEAPARLGYVLRRFDGARRLGNRVRVVVG